MCQGLVLALSMFVFLFAEEKHLACELTVAQMTHWQLIKLHKLIHLFVHLDIYLVLLLGQHHQHIRAGLDQLQRDSSDEEPECDDFMHSMLVVHLDPGLLVSNYQTAPVVDVDVGKESRNSQVGVHILLFILVVDCIYVPKLVRHKVSSSLVHRQSFQLFVELNLSKTVYGFAWFCD